jgi:uncharacterized protein YbbC (DUF1343 family)
MESQKTDYDDDRKFRRISKGLKMFAVTIHLGLEDWTEMIAVRIGTMWNRVLLRVGLGVFAVAAGLIVSGAAAFGPVALGQEPAASGGKWAETIDRLVGLAIEEGKMPGCVIGFGSSQGLMWKKAYGLRSVEPQPVQMTLDTVFDLASLTKPIATATGVMHLIESGLIRLDAPVSEYLPEFVSEGKKEITVRQLLIHTSGLIPDNPMSDYTEGPEVAWQKICELKPQAQPGKAFKYSDVNFIVLGKLIERKSGMRLDQYVREKTLAPLDMVDSGYGVPEALRDRCAPSEKRDGEWMIGTVHDPRAWALAGIAGHAGLFSTLDDLRKYAQALLQPRIRRADGEPVAWLQPGTIRLMTTPNRVPGGARALGWDMQTGFSSNRGDLLGPRAFGHGGFTGTVIWIDPDRDFFFIFLSNRLHPDGVGSVNGLAGQILNVLMTSRSQNESVSELRNPVRLGIDVLQDRGFAPLQGKRIGLITNQTGLDSRGVPTGQILRDAAGVKLAALFSPEHGIAGNLDVSRIENGIDRDTGLTIYSLYGETRKPTAEMLAGVDALVFDIQDIGARFYTYISTMGDAMTAAAEQKREFIVLDRPNPINGIHVSGPMLDAGTESFVGYHSLPLRHGMTVGEMAMMFREERKLDVELTIVPCEHWNRATYWDSTGLPWTNPSPNMRSLRQAFLYPGVGFLETTNVSVGRGTDTPFEIVGAPWINSRVLAEELNRQQLAGVVFIPRSFTPTGSKYQGQLCQGVEVIVTDRERCEPVGVGIAIAIALRKLHENDWETKSLHRLLGNRAVVDGILDKSLFSGDDPRMRDGLSEFLSRKAQYQLYP